jgi:hypothetical protein
LKLKEHLWKYKKLAQQQQQSCPKLPLVILYLLAHVKMIINVGLVPFDWGTLDIILLPKQRGPWLRLRINLKFQFFNLKKKKKSFTTIIIPTKKLMHMKGTFMQLAQG